MKKIKKFVAMVCIMACLGTSAAFAADDNMQGCGYEECRRTPCISPAVALGTIAVVAIIAVIIQNRSHGSHHHG